MRASERRRAIAASYDDIAAERAARPRFEYREHFLYDYLDLLRTEGRSRVVEVGAGAGQDAMLFHDGGIDLLATDLSIESVRHCRLRGLDAVVADFHDLPFADGEWEAGLAMSTLIHATDSEVDSALLEIRRVLRGGAPLGVGTWFDRDKEGEWADDRDPRRVFTIRSDDSIREAVGRQFTIEDFSTVPVEDGIHYQWMVARAP